LGKGWLALAAAGALVVLGGCGDDSATGGGQDAAETTPEAASQEVEAEAAGAETAPAELRLYKRGDPIVWVRNGAEVDVLAEPGGELVRRVGRETEFGSPTVFAVEEKRGEWAGVLTPYRENGELGWVRLDSTRLRAGYTGTSAVVDLSEREATVLDTDGDVVRRFPVTVGAPGTTTPEGLFAVTDTFRGGLNPSYGCCAVALTAKQPALPSGWLGGNRIAFHGTTGAIGVAASNGCVRAADKNVKALLTDLPLGARVDIRA
jgi:hypothetical protein